MTSIHPALKFFVENRILQNILFWLVFAIVPFISNLGSFGTAANMYTDIQYYLECAFLGYFNNLVLMPLLIDKGKYVRYILMVLLTIPIFEVISSQVTMVISPGYKVTLTDHLYNAWDFLIFTTAFASSYLLRSFIQQSKRINKLEEEKLHSEIAFLRSQINPHLLFNTLNTIYSLSLRSSKETPTMILKLSDIMRYMLYETNEPQVPLARELKYLEDYVNLQNARIEGRGKVDFTIAGDPSNLRIAPMLLVVFIENAFKHSMDSLSTGIAISIFFKIDMEQLDFKIANNFEATKSTDLYSGIGLKNVKKRLELLYPDRYLLDIQVSSDSYKVALKLNLAP